MPAIKEVWKQHCLFSFPCRISTRKHYSPSVYFEAKTKEEKKTGMCLQVHTTIFLLLRHWWSSIFSVGWGENECSHLWRWGSRTGDRCIQASVGCIILHDVARRWRIVYSPFLWIVTALLEARSFPMLWYEPCHRLFFAIPDRFWSHKMYFSHSGCLGL